MFIGLEKKERHKSKWVYNTPQNEEAGGSFPSSEDVVWWHCELCFMEVSELKI